MRARVFLHGVMVALLLVLIPATQAQEASPDPVLDVMAQMSPEAKVGQLVLVSFPNLEVGDGSNIATLIQEYGIGGVLLHPQNGNFADAQVTPTALMSAVNLLQRTAWDAAQSRDFVLAGEEAAPSGRPYVPLFVSLPATVDGLPISTFVSDATPLPAPMAVGATWDRSLAQDAGQVLGQELAALGINLLLGPDLDVLYTPRPGDPSDLGTSVFGGDPFWAGELGKAYIQGLHLGSERRLQVAPRHLPGLGSADRPLHEEVPTVQKPLEQLKQIELAPFFSVSQQPIGEEGVADALLVTHIRYRGFQGNIRQTTRPISLDAQPLQSVMEEFADWRGSGGVLICDNLGMNSVHRSYDPRGVTFYARRVAQDALGAGNDLLILDRFAAQTETWGEEEWNAHFANVRDTLDFLASRYKDTPTFQARVDEAVYRILSMKMRVYGDFSQLVQTNPNQLPELLELDANVNVQVALNALTRVFPLSEDRLPDPPQEGDLIVIFTQERIVQWGPTNSPLVLLSRDALSEALLRFYGPEGTGVVRLNSVRSFTFEELQTALDEDALGALPTPIPEETPEQEAGDPTPTASAGAEEVEVPSTSRLIASVLRQARWIVFASTGLDAEEPSSMALKNFLAEQAGLLDAEIVVLAFGPPYELDGTEISKLGLYYALYSPGEAFVDVGVRALFRDLLAPGDSPVDIPALDYYIPQQTMPDPNQLISLNIVNEEGEVLTQTETSEIVIGDVIGLRTGVIVDRNGHPVPDGTPVQFVLSYPQESVMVVERTEVHDGVGVTSVTLDRVGQLDITAQAEPALSSVRLQLTIRDEGPVEITAIAPTPTSTPTPTPTPTSTPTMTPTPISPKTQQLPEPIRLPQPDRSRLLAWAFGGVVSVGVLGFLWARERAFHVADAVRVALWSAIASLGGYIVLVAIGRWWLPQWFYTLVGQEFIAGGVVLVSGGLVLLAVVVTYYVRQRYAR